jgi:hypothetical protein
MLPRSQARHLAEGFALLLLPALAVAESPPRSSASDIPLPGVVRTPLPPRQVEGLPLALVFYDLRGAAGVTGGDEVARGRIEQAFGLQAGSAFNEQTAGIALQRVQSLEFVKSAGYSIYDSERAGYVVLVLSVEFGAKETTAAPKGLLNGRWEDFPTLYQDDRTYVRLLLDGGLGYYTDFNPWFGNAPAFTDRSPIALDPAGGASASWGELNAEYGLAAITRIADSPVWAYAAGSFLTSVSTGQDLYRSDTRELTRLEDLYGGFVIGRPGVDWSANVSAGRQNWQLNDGFLFSRFAAGANAGPNPALYLNPRTAYEMTALAQIKWRNLRLEGFYVDPAEIDFLDSDSAYAGVNLAYTAPGGVEASALYYEAPRSDTVFRRDSFGAVPREGLQVFDARLGSTNLLGFRGLELFGEHAWQSNRHVDWDARAWYLRTGYSFTSLPWTPNLSYRYASFSGDDPETPVYERFDAQLSSGLDTWVQGVSFKKVVGNTNLNSHRIRLNVAPTDTLSLTVDYFWLLADETGTSADYGQELNLALRWAISRNLFFLGVAGLAFPGDALRAQAGTDLDNWATLQASLFFNF